MVLLKFVKLMFLATALAVVYIHMQMQIIQLAYDGKTKENEIKKLIEKNDNLVHDILTLKSANHLGEEMFTEKSKMKFVGPDNIVKLQAPEDILSYRVAQSSQRQEQQFVQFLGFLSFGTEAEARTNR